MYLAIASGSNKNLCHVLEVSVFFQLRHIYVSAATGPSSEVCRTKIETGLKELIQTFLEIVFNDSVDSRSLWCTDPISDLYVLGFAFRWGNGDLYRRALRG